jgi:hypothetical protein
VTQEVDDILLHYFVGADSLPVFDLRVGS